MKRTLRPILALLLAVSPLALPAQMVDLRVDSANAHKSAVASNLARRDAAIAGIKVHRAARDSMPTLARVQQGPPTGQSKLFMVLGGAAFVGGLLIGDDAGTAIAVVGLGLGVYGLYLYMR